MPAPYSVRRQRYRVRLQVSLALSLTLVLVAFSVPTPHREAVAVLLDPVGPDTMLVIPTDPQTPPPPPPAPPPPVEVVNDAEILDAIVPPMAFAPTDLIRTTGPPAPAIAAPPPVPTPEADAPPTPDIPVPTDLVEFLPLEDQPVLIGGIEGLQQRVVYPDVALKVGVQGTVFVQFVVDETGRVVDPVAMRSPHPALSEAALAAVATSRFEPGLQRGRPVRARFTLPVRFVLR